jgi:hypothetical protein
MVDVAARLGGGEDALAHAAMVSLLHRIEIAEESGLSPESVVKALSDEARKKKSGARSPLGAPVPSLAPR